MPPTSYPYIL